LKIFIELGNPKINMGPQNPSKLAKPLLNKKNKAGGITLPDFKIYYTTIIVKTVWCLHKNRYRAREQGREPISDPQHPLLTNF
jgi:hypothetical protein